MRPKSLLFALVLVLAGLLAAPLSADTTYTYVGNQLALQSGTAGFNTFFGCLSLPFCGLQIELTLPTPLAANLFDDSVTPSDWQIGDSYGVFQCCDPSESVTFLITTDSAGNITNWAVELHDDLGPFLAGPNAGQDDSILIFSNNGEDFEENLVSGLGVAAEIANAGEPGTWVMQTAGGGGGGTNTVPEPGSLALIGTGGLVLGTTARRRLRATLRWLPRSRVMLMTILVLILGAAFHEAQGATIDVTYLGQRVTGGPGCSLQEAIWASNLHASLAISGVNSDGSDSFVATNCTAGDGNDTIVLPFKAVLVLTTPVPDIHSILGPAANPIVFSNITIEGYGAELLWLGAGHARAFSVGGAFVPLPGGGATTGTGNLILRNLFIVGFIAKGGNGGSGGGGGLGAGGAIYVKDGSVTVENSTFFVNSAIGGNGSTQDSAGWGGGGGGIDGNGGMGVPAIGGGGGGGGATGDGGPGGFNGGGGGGTLTAGISGNGLDGGAGGLNCGGAGGTVATLFGGGDGFAAPCSGGGGGGGGIPDELGPEICVRIGGTGGNGGYGGGGGGGGNGPILDPDCNIGSPGGDGGFGGGGGAAGVTESGGEGGFGGGGGASGNHPGKGGTFGGDANDTNGATASNGGGGAGLGGAIFSDNGTVILENSTFTQNVAAGGSGGKFSGLTPGNDGSDAGGAIFMLNGSLAVKNSTFAKNAAAGSSGGIQIYQLDSTPTSFTLLNTIIYGNSGFNECSVQANSVTSAGIVGNLIENNDPLNPCLVNGSGVVSTLDPGLGQLLQDNGGYTPTLTITKGLAAWGTADSATSLLPSDQRGFPRPSDDGHGLDIGAFELCTPTHPSVSPFPCTTPTSALVAALTMQVSPLNGGTTSPAAGSVTTYPQGSIAPIQAIPSVGYAFTGWTGGVPGNITDTTNPSTTIIMSQDQTVTANFVLSPCGNTLTGRGTASSTYSPARVGLVWGSIVGLNHWEILRATALAGPYSTIASVSASATSYLDNSGLQDGQAYDYTLKAFDGNGNLMCWSNQKAIFVP